MHIGNYQLDNPLILAPMAGVTDQPFRQLCKQLGAGMTVSEMITADPRLWNSKKSRLRRVHQGEIGIRSVQIAGTEPEIMALAAQHNVEHGAQIIDINMGCPAKKVCKKAAGSALLQDPDLVERILKAVVAAVDVPVTLKIRTGQDANNRNALIIAKIAEEADVKALAIHGRTRSDKFMGEAEFETIAAIKQAVSIPIMANGDIDNPEKAKWVKDYTQADGLMIGRAAQGKPWIFREIWHFLQTGEHLESPSWQEIQQILFQHMNGLYQLYGEVMGPRIARKHVSWYLQEQDDGKEFRRTFNKIEDAKTQLETLKYYFKQKQQAKAA
ncbi:tRNA dihydrouridine synthase DusB [Kangiella sp. HZ709]|uniref:tRNA dihydrouridine synthase DusB n=1 Tax=Kangiella sp. HZ709 TaxID=2666328 RepID=UPI0012AFB23A|nr:tRNA dihydrouridine synthase DusB [Kangiella sp. HZ709]MRX28132.1 tRNA dihydrouridine synthase DusB [Kangiella sp. HZ709]